MVMIEGQEVTGTYTNRGFVHHLERHGVRMPIQIERTKDSAFGKFPEPRIYGEASHWALPGGGVYIHREVIRIT